jgi:NADH-quinone oxidoreductase subunit J
MIIADLLFYVFSALMLLSGAVVISARNAVHSVLFLILAFFNAAGLFVLMGAEYVAMLLVIVYVGAVAVLFLFVVMMLNLSLRERGTFRKHIPVGLLVGLVLLTELVLVFRSWTSAETAINNRLFPSATHDSIGGASALGDILYTNYLYPFQISGLILLVAMIGAITLCFRTRSGVRKQKAYTQVTRTQEESMEITTPERGQGVTL